MFFCPHTLVRGFPGGSDGKECAFSVGDPGSIPGLGRSPGEGHDNLLQYSCLKIFMDRGTWWATVHRVAKSQRRLSKLHFLFTKCLAPLHTGCSVFFTLLNIRTSLLKYLRSSPFWRKYNLSIPTLIVILSGKVSPHWAPCGVAMIHATYME